MTEIIFSVAAKVAENLVNPTFRQGQYMFCAKKITKNLLQKKEELASEKGRIQRRADQAAKKTDIIEDEVKSWMEKVNDVLQEVERLEREIEANNCYEGWCPTCRRFRLCKQMVQKTKMVIDLKNNCEFDPFSHPAPLPSIEYESSKGFIYFESTRLAYNRLFEALRDDSTRTIGLYGMGGSGKTTLVTEVGKKAKELELFNLVLSVTVSQTPDIRSIQGKMADMLGLRLEEESKEGRAQRLWLRLKEEKRVLVIVDDVWTNFNLKDIGIEFNENNEGSHKVLLTTRRQQVCILMDCGQKIPLGLLSEEEAWKLFRNFAAMDDQSSFSIIEREAREVARECKGLPIAIKAVASSLKGKLDKSQLHEWKVASQNLKHSKPIDVEEGERDAMSCLMLSYDYLRNKEAELLFIMCAMFPEDYEIPVEHLIRYGVGLGVCGEYESFDLARSQVKVGLNKLIDSCLLMHSEESNDHVKMHDLVRDTALWISSKEDRAIVVNTEKDLNSLVMNGVTKNCFAVSSWYTDTYEISYQWDVPKLEILILNAEYSGELSIASFDGMKGLKVMAITNDLISIDKKSLSLPQSIQFLTNLRTLCLRYWDLGDISLIASLRKLEVLDLRDCSFKEVPEGIEKLNKLKLLDLREAKVKENYNSKGIARCPQLEEFYFSRTYFERPPQSFVHDLASTNLQRYELLLGTIWDPFQKADDSITKVVKIRDFDISTIIGSKNHLLQKAEKIKFLELNGGCNNVIPDMVRVVGGMNELKVLELFDCKQIECLTDTDSLQEDALLPNLVNLKLEELNNLEELYRGRPVLGFFEQLEKLHISHCRKLQNTFPKEGKLCNLKILNLNGCAVVTLFSLCVARSLQRLQQLIVQGCSKLRHMIANEGDEICPALDNSPFMFPNLKKLQVSNCDKLQFVLPISCGHQGLAQLQVIRISECDELKYVFGPYDNSSRDQIQILLPSLQVFQLRSLGNLIGMCPQNCDASWPSLRKLDWDNCPGLTASWICSYQHQNAGVAPTYDHTKHLIFKLETLRIFILSELRIICSGPQILSFQYLHKLEVLSCSKQKYILQMTCHVNLPELKYLCIESCDEVEEIIAKNEEEPPNHSNAQACFPKLEELFIRRCNKLKSLFSAAMIRTLPRLQTLDIRDCAHLQEIFGCTANEEEIVLPNLGDITLIRLPSLVDICQGFKLHKQMQLKDVVIEGCPNFTPGANQVVPFPNIAEDEIILWEISKCSNQLCQQQMLPAAPESFLNIESISLADNCRVEGILKIKVEGGLHIAEKSMHSNLNELILKDLLELRFIWSCPISFMGFHKLGYVKVEGCAKLKTIFPPGIVGSLQNLKYLTIINCEELDEIIMSPDLEVVCLPNLQRMKVDKCDKLKCLFSSSLSCDFPQLYALSIEECNKLKCLFSGSVICNLPDLFFINIKNCAELERVFHFKPTEAGDDGDKDHGEQQVVLPELRYLTLESLPNFTEIEKLQAQVVEDPEPAIEEDSSTSSHAMTFCL